MAMDYKHLLKHFAFQPMPADLRLNSLLDVTELA